MENRLSTMVVFYLLFSYLIFVATGSGLQYRLGLAIVSNGTAASQTFLPRAKDLTQTSRILENILPAHHSFPAQRPLAPRSSRFI